MKSVVLALSFMAVQSLASSLAAQDSSLSARQADFKSFVQDFQASYAYLDRADKPWLTWESRYASAVEQADSKEAFNAVLASALSELHDFHAEVRSKVVNRWLPVPTFEDIWAQFTSAGAVVAAVRQGSDAQRAGILAGDQITKVGAESLETAIAERLGGDQSRLTPQARQWALLSVLTGRSEEARTLTLKKQNGGCLYRHIGCEAAF